MGQKKVRFGICAALFAAVLSVFGATAMAQASSGSWPSDNYGNTINSYINTGIGDVNTAIQTGGGYASLAWDAAPTATGGTINTTITKDATIASVRRDIVNVLVTSLAKYTDTVQSVQLASPTIMGDPNPGNVILNLKDATEANVVTFAKGCVGNYSPGQGIVSLIGRSFSIQCNPVSGASGVQTATYTMNFVKGNSGSDQTVTPSQVQSAVNNEAMNTASQNALNNGATGSGTNSVTVVNDPANNGNVTWEVNVNNTSTPAASIYQNFVGNVLSTAAFTAPSATATSGQNKNITIEFEGAKAEDIDNFSEDCMNAAVAIPAQTTTASGGSEITNIGDLIGKYFSIVVSGLGTGNDSVTYTFEFAGTVDSLTATIKETIASTTGLDESKYTAKSWDDLQAAITAAQNAMNATNPNVDDLQDALDKLNAAINALVEGVPVYRLYNKYDKFHLYTTDLNEYEENQKLGWDGEGIAWYASPELETGGVKVQRYYNKYNGDHYFSGDPEEQAKLIEDGWQEDDQYFNGFAANDYAIQTFWNPWNQVDTHMWTTDQREADDLEARGWILNDLVYYAVALP